jgi:hypothetical protein
MEVSRVFLSHPPEVLSRATALSQDPEAGEPAHRYPPFAPHAP